MAGFDVEGAGLDFFGADGEQVGDFFEFGAAHFGADFFVGVVHGGADVFFAQPGADFVGVGGVGVGDGEDAGLFGGQPEGEVAGEVFYQDADEAFE